MKYLTSTILAFLLASLALPWPMLAATVTPATDETTISTTKPALGYPSKKLLPSQHQPTVTVYPAGTTSSARGGDTVSIASTDIGTTTPTPGAIPVAGTDSKISTGWLPTSVLTGTGTTNYLPKKTASGYGDSRVVDDGINPVEAPNLQLTGLLTSTTFPLTQLSQLSGAYVLVAPDPGAHGTSTGLVFRSAPAGAGGIFKNAIVSRRFGIVWQAALDFYVHPSGTANVDEMKLALTLDDSGALLYGLLSANGVALRGSTYGSIARQASATGGVTTLVEPSAPPTAVGQVLAVASLSTTGTATNTATLSWKAVLGEDATLSTTPPLAIASTGTITETVTNTDTSTVTNTGTNTGNGTGSGTGTGTSSQTVTVTANGTATNTGSATATVTARFTGTATNTAWFGGWTNSASYTQTSTNTGTRTVTFTASNSTTLTETYTATGYNFAPGETKTFTSDATGTLTGTISGASTAAVTGNATGTVTGDLTGTVTGTGTGTGAGTGSGTPTATTTQTSTFAVPGGFVGEYGFSRTATNTYVHPRTATWTVTGTGTGTIVLVFGQVVTFTYTDTATKTRTASGSVTAEGTTSLTNTKTATGTVAGTVTGAVSGSGSWTATDTTTSTSTATQTTTGSSTNAATGRIADNLTISGGASAITGTAGVIPKIGPTGSGTVDSSLSDDGAGTVTGRAPGLTTYDLKLLSDDTVGEGYSHQRITLGTTNGPKWMIDGFKAGSGEENTNTTQLVFKLDGTIFAAAYRFTATGLPAITFLSNVTTPNLLQIPAAPCGAGQALTSTSGPTTTCVDIGGSGSLSRPTNVCADGEVLTTYSDGVTTCVSNGSGSGIACAGGSCTTYRLPMFTNSSSVANSPITASGSDVYIDHYIVASNIDINGNTTGRAAGDCHSDGTNCPTAATLGGTPDNLSITANNNPSAVTYDNRGRVTGAQSITPAWIGALGQPQRGQSVNSGSVTTASDGSWADVAVVSVSTSGGVLEAHGSTTVYPSSAGTCYARIVTLYGSTTTVVGPTYVSGSSSGNLMNLATTGMTESPPAGAYTVRLQISATTGLTCIASANQSVLWVRRDTM